MLTVTRLGSGRPRWVPGEGPGHLAVWWRLEGNLSLVPQSHPTRASESPSFGTLISTTSREQQADAPGSAPCSRDDGELTDHAAEIGPGRDTVIVTRARRVERLYPSYVGRLAGPAQQGRRQ